MGAPLIAGKSNVQMGEFYGISETSVRRHKSHTSPQDVQLFADVPDEMVTARGRTVRLADGSYEKISWQPNAMAMHEALTKYIDIDRAFEGYVPMAAPTSGGGFGTAVNAADWQIGKAHQRGGGTPETEAQIKRSFSRAADRIEYEKPSALVLSDNGDIIENIWNVKSQGFTNDLDVPAQIFKAWNLMTEGIKLLAPLVPDMRVVSMPSNHSAARVDYKTPGGTVDADFGLMIHKMLEEQFADRDGFEHVQFVRPEPMYETAVVEACGTRLAYHHGHQAGKQDSQGTWWKGQDHGRMPGWDADILVTAHFHNMSLRQSGNGRWIITCSACEPSSDWFTDSSGETSQKGMTVFNFRDGEWDNPKVL